MKGVGEYKMRIGKKQHIQSIYIKKSEGNMVRYEGNYLKPSKDEVGAM